MKVLRLSVLRGFTLTSLWVRSVLDLPHGAMLHPWSPCGRYPLLLFMSFDVFTGFWTIRPRVTGIAIDLTCHVRAQSLNGTLLGVLLIVVQSLHKEIQLERRAFPSP